MTDFSANHASPNDNPPRITVLGVMLMLAILGIVGALLLKYWA